MRELNERSRNDGEKNIDFDLPQIFPSDIYKSLLIKLDSLERSERRAAGM